ncbi:TIGR00730 family Rossman fold protein [Ideonella sp. 4Y11]|uniref:Cytokinin riboside 5'-monophosphate phosphoribohydrolase n=1 Tax=Ideonella aquatica TaxID=2824119 RepID=A0A940YPM8_9BURK|nr:TIGR00730 family Rossman fold protein [Ideonella aquatica]MBQ0959708.1 TIGR00730 family Rossman fold protein [Ideonella aquatica]
MSAVRPFSVCVYCGSRHGVRPEYTAAARAMGQAIGERGWRLVYGGGNVGLMGEVADATLAAGGTVLGVIPERLLQREVGHHGLTELVVVQNMHQRKMRMAEEADAFVALPGGIGTFEELFEMWSWRHLGYHGKPLGLLEVQGFWAPLVGFLRGTVAAGFMDDSQMTMLALQADPAALLTQLAAAPSRQAADYRGT